MKNLILYLSFVLFIKTATFSQSIPWELLPNFDNDYCTLESTNLIQNILTTNNCNIFDNSIDFCRKFIPTLNQQIISIRLNLVFIQKSDGTGNFREDNQEEQSIINDMINELNRIYANWVNPDDPLCYVGTDFVSDTRIQFIANKIFIRDNFGWNNKNDPQTIKCPGISNWYLNYLDNQINVNQNIPRGINIYFTEDSLTYDKYWIQQPTDTSSFTGQNYGCSQFPSFTNYSSTSKIHQVDSYSKYWYMKNTVPKLGKYGYQQWNPVVRSWEVNSLALGLAHEIGHSFNLYHPYYPYYPSSSCINTLMNPSGNSPRNFLPPTEIGRVFGAASFTNIRSFVPIDNYLGIKNIATSDSWYNMRLFSSLNIMQNVQLTLPCEITMPFQSFINVSGKLFVNEANIHSITNHWDGITVKSGGLLILNSTSIADYNVTVESGGTVIIKGGLIISGEHSIQVFSGGYFCFDNNPIISLTDYLSLIKINEGAINGINPLLSGISTNCGTIPTHTGNGAIADFNQDVYIQNETLSTNRYIGGKNIFVGNHVTTTKSYGDVQINNGANIIFDCKEITFDAGFECAVGSTFEVKNH